jgi:hypothetical protein
VCDLEMPPRQQIIPNQGGGRPSSPAPSNRCPACRGQIPPPLVPRRRLPLSLSECRAAFLRASHGLEAEREQGFARLPRLYSHQTDVFPRPSPVTTGAPRRGQARQGQVRSGQDKTRHIRPAQARTPVRDHACRRETCPESPVRAHAVRRIEVLFSLSFCFQSPAHLGEREWEVRKPRSGCSEPISPTASQHHDHYHHLTIRPDELRHSKYPLLLFPSLTANTPPGRP